MSDDLTTTEALAAVRARLDQAYAMKAEAEQSIKDLTTALIEIGKEAVLRSGSVTERLPVANEGHPGPEHTR